MSIKVMGRVWAHSPFAGTELLTQLALADWADDDGWCWPSLRQLRVKVRLSERQMCKVLTDLEHGRGIERDRSRGGRNRRTRYRVIVPENTVVDNTVTENTVIHGRKTLSPIADALIRHRTVNKREKAPDGAEPSGSQSFSPSKKRKHTRPDPLASDLRVKPFLSWFAEEYQKRFDTPYVVNWGKDGKRLNELAPAFDVPKLKDLAIRFFESQDPWIWEKGGFTFGVFMSLINKLASTANGNGHVQPPPVKDLGDGWLEMDGMKISRKDYDRRWNNN
jgi:hypothetical protein